MKTITTFTYVIKGIPISTKTEDLKQRLKGKFSITNLTRIREDKGPLPLIRLYTKETELVSKLITNGITIGFSTYKVEA